jgi:RimJ/RimL family protein N-acetyltransferase
MNDESILINLFTQITFPTNAEKEEAWIDSFSPDSLCEYILAVQKNDTGKFIGGIEINNLDLKNRNCTIAVYMHPDYLGKGIGTQAIKLLLDFLFQRFSLNKIKLNVFDYNERAIKSYKKVGFVEEGVLRQELFTLNKYHDIVMMSILKQEWNRHDAKN